MSLDEVDRMRTSDVKWIENAYPLVYGVPKRRHECALLIREFGLPEPPKSACFMCPNRNNAEWVQQREEAPGDWQKAIELEREMRLKDAGLFLHKQRVPLDMVDFTEPESAQMDLCANWCWT